MAGLEEEAAGGLVDGGALLGGHIDIDAGAEDHVGLVDLAEDAAKLFVAELEVVWPLEPGLEVRLFEDGGDGVGECLGEAGGGFGPAEGEGDVEVDAAGRGPVAAALADAGALLFGADAGDLIGGKGGSLAFSEEVCRINFV